MIAQPLASDLQAAAHLECKTTAPLGADIEDIFLPEILAAMSEPALGGDPEWNCVLEENTPATARMAMSDIPTLVIYGEDDQLVAPALERPAFQSMCERGANLSYMECAGQTHEDAVLQTIDDTLDFIDYVFEHGESPSESCVVRQPEDC